MSAKLSTLLTSNPVAAAALAKADGLYLYDASAIGSLKSAGTRLSSLAGALGTYAASSNASGNTTLTLGALAMQHTEVTTVSGAGSTTRVMILELATSAPTAGAVLQHRLDLPATAGITVEWRNATAGGTLLTSLITDGSGDDAVAEFHYDGSAWQFLRFTSPAAGSAVVTAAHGGTGQTTYAKGDLLASPGSNTLNKLGVGADGYVLIADSAATNGMKWATVAGTGDVVGPASATDGVPVLFDGTTGKLIKNSKVTLTQPATGSTLTVADGKTLTASNTLTLTATDGSTLAIGTGGTLGTAAYTAATAYATAAQGATADTALQPGGALGTPSSGVATNLTGTAAGLTAGTVTTNANLTGDVTSVGNATTLAAGSASNLNSGTLPAARMPALTGDVTTSSGAVATTLATVNSNVGTYGSATKASVVTVSAKGLVTAASESTVTPAVGSLTGLGTGVATALATNTYTSGTSLVTGYNAAGLNRVAVWDHSNARLSDADTTPPVSFSTVDTVGTIGLGTAAGSSGPKLTITSIGTTKYAQQSFVNDTAAILNFNALGSAMAGTTMGMSNANLAVVESQTTASALAILTRGTKDLVLGTNATKAATINGTTQAATLWGDVTAAKTITVGTAGTTAGTVTLSGVTSGTTILTPDAVASGTQTVPAGTGTLLSSSAAVTVAQGGTGVATLTAYAPIFGGTTSTGAVQSGTVGTAGHVLTSNGAGALPTFQAAAGGGDTVISPTNLAADTNDWNPTSLSTATVIRVSCSAGPYYISSITAPAGGAQRLRLLNVSANTLILRDQLCGLGTAANRMSFGGVDVPLFPGSGVDLIYDSTSSLWRGVDIQIIPTTRQGYYLNNHYSGALATSGGVFNLIASSGAGGGSGQGAGTIGPSASDLIETWYGETGTGTTGYGGVVGNNGSAFMLGSTNYWRMSFRLKSPTASDGTNTFTMRVGFTDGAANADGADGIYLRYTDGVNSGNWVLVMRNNSTETSPLSCSAGPTFSSSVSNEISIIYLPSRIEVWQNGVNIGSTPTLTTVPTSRATDVGFGIIKSAGTSTRIMQVNGMEVVAYRPTP